MGTFGKDVEMVDKVFEKVKKMTLDRVASAVKAGRRLERGNWANAASCCAVGAIAFNGDPIEEYLNWRGQVPTPGTYAVATPFLIECGVPVDEVGFVLDAISGGFEGLSERVVQYSSVGDTGLCPTYNLKNAYEPYFELGRSIHEAYASYEEDDED